MGVYRAYSPLGGPSFVGFSRNLEGTYKRLRFELTLNACPYISLQELWNRQGALTLELLEEYDISAMGDEEACAYEMARLMAWKERLGPETQLIQQQVIV